LICKHDLPKNFRIKTAWHVKQKHKKTQSKDTNTDQHNIRYSNRENIRSLGVLKLHTWQLRNFSNRKSSAVFVTRNTSFNTIQQTAYTMTCWLGSASNLYQQTPLKRGCCDLELTKDESLESYKSQYYHTQFQRLELLSRVAS
jgi:hypothetical protein